MANIKISELSPLVTVQDADVLPIVDNAITKKVTAAILRTYTQGNSVLLTGAQTIAGIKTFTSQLASTVATGTAPFSVASTTKVTNLNADLLDGLSSADFQATLSGTGIVKSTAGTISYLTDNSTNWNTAFNDKINSAAVTGSGTNTLTLTQQDAGTITATWVNGTLIREIRNNTGATLTKGTIVYISGATGNKPTVTKAIATGDSTSAQTFGFVQENIANNANGYVVVIGDLTGVDTSAFTEGDQLYLSATVAGAFTATKQYAPNHLVYVGIVTRSHPTLGQIEVNIQNGYEMDELHNVAAQSPSNGDILQYVTSTGLWTKIAGTTSAISEGTNLYFTDARARAAISLTTTGTSGAATYTSGVLNIPQYQSALTNPITGTGTTNYLPKFTGASALGNSLLQEGTVAIGLGVTPSAWVGTSRALQIGTRAALWDSGGATLLGYNVFNDGVNKYLVTGSSMRYFMSDGGHTWNIAPSGTAGGAITFTTAMTLDTSGQLGIGTATPNEKLEIKGTTTGVLRLSSTSFSYNLFTNNSDGGFYLRDVTNSANRLIISSTGAATFSSTLTTGLSSATGTQLTLNALYANGITFLNTNVGVDNRNFRIITDQGVYGTFNIQKSTTQGGSTYANLLSFDQNSVATFVADATINGVKVGRGAGSIATNTAVGFEAINANVSGTGITALGYQALRASTGGSNTGIGYQSLLVNSTATQNTAVGFLSLAATTTGASNTACGSQALAANVTASNNTALGRSALTANTASNNTAVGFEAALTNTSGTGITAIGYQALKASTGANNTAVGFQSLVVNSTGTNNTALGDRALTANTTGITNTAIGQAALFTNIVGNNNTAVGTSALFTSTGSANTAVGTSALLNNTASNNTAVGFESASANTSGTSITAIGFQALKSNTTGNSNVSIGYQSLFFNSTGLQNTSIGVSSSADNTTGNNNSVLGYNTYTGNFSGSVVLGVSATATAGNQFVVGSAGINAGTVASEVNASTKVWNVRINGVAQKILLA